jgi:hypothetical protein
LGEWGYAITLLSSQQELHNDFGNQSAPVGGATVPTDVLTLLALWIKLLALTGVMLVGAVVVTRARRALSR